MSTQPTRASLKNQIMQHVLYLMDNEQAIPLSKQCIALEGLGEVSSHMVSKEGSVYTLFLLDEQSAEYGTKTITKEKAFLLVQEQFKRLNKAALKEELSYWEEVALFFKEEEEKNVLFFSQNKRP